MPDDPPSIRIDPTPPRSRGLKSGKTRSSRQIPLAAGIVASLLACIGAALWFASGRGDESSPPDAGPLVRQVGPAQNAHDEATPAPALPAGTVEEIVADDGQLLWASPTAGDPIAMDWMPDGVQIIVHLRPRQLVAHDQWPQVAAGLGPWGEDALLWLRRLTGCELDELETMLLAATMLPDGAPGFVVRATLSTSWDAADLANRFPRSEAVAGPYPQVVHDERVVVLPEDQTLVIYPASLADEALRSSPGPPMIVRDLERLLEQSDSRRSVSLLLAPRFLEAGGGQLLGDSGRPLRRVLQWLVDDDATAVSLSVHLDDNLFMELAATPTSITPPRRLALNLLTNVHAAAEKVEDILLARDWPTYGQKVLIRFPSMLRTLARYTRFAAEEQTALVRCYLPGVAAHNLITAGELLLTLPAGEAVAAPPAATPHALEERLAQTTTLVFAKETLEESLAQLSEAIDVPIEIAGRDLQLLGITKNQSLTLNLRDQPAVEILQQILRRANPDQAAASLDDPRQQLVYVIARDGASGKEGVQGRIIVTTRTAATTRGDRLPEVFVLPGE